MHIVNSIVPKQRRSQESFDRVLDSTVALLKEQGLSSVTLSEVSRRAKVSIGSIYGRVDGKQALIREVQVRALDKLDRERDAAIRRLRSRALGLRELVPAVVREICRFHRRHAGLLSAFIEQSALDREVERVGKRHHSQMLQSFAELLLDRADEFVHPEASHAAATCIAVTYGAIARFLGLGGAQDAVGEGDWRRLTEDLGLMTLAFLTVDLRQMRPQRDNAAIF